MNDFKKHPAKVHYTLRFALAFLGMLFLFFMTGVAATSAWGMYGTFKVAAQDRGDTEDQLASLTSEQARISAAVVSFNTQEGMEGQVRERFGVAKPGEGEIQIVRNDTPVPVQPAPSQNIFVRAIHALFVW